MPASRLAPLCFRSPLLSLAFFAPPDAAFALNQTETPLLTEALTLCNCSTAVVPERTSAQM